MKRLLNFKFKFILLFLFVISFVSPCISQLDNYFLTGAKKEKLDTLAFEHAKEIVKETYGLLEKEVEPDKYIVGPNDVFTISIITSTPKYFKATVSPEGKLIIPYVGIVDLKETTLEKAEDLILERIKKVYKTEDVYVTLSEVRKFKVSVSGKVQKTAIVSATAVDRVSEVIERAGGLKFDASYRRITLLRSDKNQQISVDLLRYYMLGDKNVNPTVLGGDNVVVPSSDTNQTIEIFGEVSGPGKFEFVKGDSLSHLIKFGLGFLETAFLDSVELSRFSSSGNQIERYFININSWKDLLSSGKPLPGDFPLKSGDKVFIRRIPAWHLSQTVIIVGEVNLPGHYSINNKVEKVSDLIKRAGGYTQYASIQDALLIRRQEMYAEDKEMDRLWRIQPSDMSESELQYFRARIREKRGAMAVNFEKIMKDPNSSDNIILENKDSIYVPAKKVFVNVQGRVNNPGMIIYRPEYTYKDYIALAGGYGFRSDKGSTFIVKANGQQYSAESEDYELEPGDVVLVPEEPDLTFMEVFTTSLTIVAQIVTIIGVVLALMKL